MWHKHGSRGILIAPPTIEAAMKLLSCTLLVLLFADEPKADSGYTLLFNGKDLAGWKEKGKKDSLAGKTEAHKGRFKVEDDELVIDPTVKGDVRIETERVFAKDFVIKFEFKPDDKCKNDLFILDQKFDLSIQNVKQMKIGEWNPIEITTKDGKIEFRVSGEVVRTASPKKVEKSPFEIRAEFGSIRIRKLQVKQ